MSRAAATRAPAALAGLPNVHAAHTEAQGRLLLAARPIPAGHVVISEAPSVWWLDARRRHDCCARCLAERIETNCATCGGCGWCSEECRLEDVARHRICCSSMLSSQTKLQEKIPGYGTSNVAASGASEATEELYEEATLLACVVGTAELRVSDSKSFDDVWLMHADLAGLTADEEQRCKNVLEMCPKEGDLSPIDLDFVRGVCARDKANGFNLASLGGSCDREHQERAYAFYPVLAMANHACMPTAARFDDLDTEAPPKSVAASINLPAWLNLDSAVGRLRTAAIETPSRIARPPFSLATRYVAIQPLECGTEVSISYTPLDITVAPRSDRLREEYGFSCSCARCVVEREAEGIGVGQQTQASDEDENQSIDMTYVNLFVIKYCCPHCSGTFAPKPNTTTVDDSNITQGGNGRETCMQMYTCNRCGHVRSESEFTDRVEEMMMEDSDQDDAEDAEEVEDEDMDHARSTGRAEQVAPMRFGRFVKRKHTDVE